MMHRAMILNSNVVNANNTIYTKEVLIKMAKENDKYFYEDGCLYVNFEMKDLDPESVKLIEENFWDLI